jgi:hypothetical protein
LIFWSRASPSRRLRERPSALVAAGLARVVDFQDVAYGTEYLDLVEPRALEASGGQADHPGPRGRRSRAPWPTTT